MDNKIRYDEKGWNIFKLFSSFYANMHFWWIVVDV